MELNAGQILTVLSAYTPPALLGGAAGYGFYRFIGCKTGMCPITSNPWLSIVWGAVIGASMGPLW